MPYLWQEVVVRRRVLGAHRLRGSGRPLHFRHRTPDLGGFHEVFVQRNYDPPPPALAILQSLPGNFLAADLGANIGLFGIRLLELRPDARLVAFEPDPGNAEVLRANIAANDATERWRLIPACAGVRDGAVAFRAGDFLSSQIIDGPPTTDVADVFPFIRSAEIVKIDIEGAERDILADPRFLDLEARLIALEYHPPLPRAWVERRFREAGFTLERFDERLPGVGEFWAWR